MKTLSTVLAVAALAAGHAAWAACTYPKAPEKIPDGTTATKEEMISSMKLIRAYNDQIKSYTDCLKADHDAQVAKIDPNLSQDKKDARKADLDKVLAQKNDAAVDEAQAVTDRFNLQIRAFKAKHPS